MLNRALLAKRTDFNHFTRALKRECLASGAALVRMRNDTWVEVRFQPGGEKNGPDSDSFRAKGHSLYWEANGESITSRDFDLVEFKQSKTTE